MKDTNAVSLGRKGGRAQVKKVGVEQMRKWGRKGGKSRWAGMTAEERKAATEPARAARRKKKDREVKMKFPGTKNEFDAWWNGKKDIEKPRRGHSCPVARFLQHKGLEHPYVCVDKFRDGNGHFGELPRWAQYYVSRFDGF